METFFRSLLLILFLGDFLNAQAQTPAPATTDTSAASATNKIDPAKEAEIRKLVQVMGTEKIMTQMMERMISILKMQHSNVPNEFWDRFQKEMDTQGLIEKLIPVYDKYYTLDDLKAANAFYGSPAGQHILANMPQIMRESSQIGQQWGMELGKKVAEELDKEKEQAAATAAPSPAPAEK